MTLSFDLTTQPWIPCAHLDGTVVELSTFDALAQAHRLRAIPDPSPLVVAVLHRHLLAILHRAYGGPRDMDQWAGIASAVGFDRDTIGRYLESVRDRMDLFHPTRPFAQARGLAEQFGHDPIDQLELPRSTWGSARELFQHRPANHAPSRPPAAAARALLAHHAFATGGLVRKPNEPTSATAAPLTRAAVVILRGDTLFRTLASNLLVYDPQEAQPIPGVAEDRPSWEQEPPPRTLPVSSEPKRLPLGWLDMLTWLSRRIELIMVGERVTGFVRAVHKGLHESSPRDPMVTYRKDENRGFVGLGIDPDRAFWRNANSLFSSKRAEAGSFERPRAIGLVGRSDARALLGESAEYNVDVFGLSAEKSRVDMARAETITAFARLFADPDAAEVVQHVIAVSEDAVRALHGAMWSFARRSLSAGERQPEAKDVSALARSFGAVPAAWSELGLAFNDFLRALGEGRFAEARRDYRERLARTVLARFESATGNAASGASLEARAVAELSLRGRLASLELTAFSVEPSDPKAQPVVTT